MSNANISAERLAQIYAFNKKIADMSAQVTAFEAMNPRVEREQSDKVGYDFVRHYIGDQVMMTEYVKQENPIGVPENPFIWAEDVALIQNACYEYDGVKKIWFGQKNVTAAWDDPAWTEE